MTNRMLPVIQLTVVIAPKGVGIFDLRFWQSWKRMVWHSSWGPRSK